MKRLIFFIGFMTLATVGLIQLLSTEPIQNGSDVVLPTQQPANVMNLTDVSVTLHQGQDIRWRLWAEDARLQPDGQASQLDDVDFVVYGKGADGSGAILMTGHSRSARLIGRPQQVELEREVVLNRVASSNSGALDIETEQLRYNATTGTLIAPGPVRVTTPEGDHYGDSMRYAINKDKLTFTRPRFSR